MDEYTADAFANRDELLPAIVVSPTNVDGSSSEVGSEGRRQKPKRALSASRLKMKPIEVNNPPQEKDETPPTPSLRSSIQDRLFSSLLRQVVPTEDSEDES